MTVDNLGYIYLTGEFRSTVDFDPNSGISSLSSAGFQDIFVLKLDTAGNYLWAKRIGASDAQAGFSIKLDRSSNVYTSGYIQADSVDFDPGPGVYKLAANNLRSFISKLDSAGNFIWAKVNDASSAVIALDSNENVYSTGTFGDNDDLDPGSGSYILPHSGFGDIYILKYDSLGNYIWAIGMGNANSDEGKSIVVDANNNIYTIGSFQYIVDFDPGSGTYNLNAGGSPDAFIQKLNPSITALNELSILNPIHLNPNPSSGVINVTCYKKITISKINIYNYFGQLIFEAENLNENYFQIDLSHHLNGIYLITFSTDKENYSTKIIVQH